MSNPPVPFVVARLKGFAGQRTKRPPPEPSLLPAPPEPPAFLPLYAKQEWHRVAGELYLLGLLTSVDLACLCCYCHAYSIWREASEQLEAEGLLSQTQDGRPCCNPLIKDVKDAAADMVRFANEFGVTPVARQRFANGTKQPPSKFGDLLAGPREPSA